MRVIIVEDEPHIRKGIANIITSQTEHEVVAIGENAEEGMDLILTHHPDLIITDIRMGEMNGLDMIKKLRNFGVDTAVIILTGFSDFSYAREALQSQVKDYLLKPVMVEELLDSIRRIQEEQKKQVWQGSLEQLLQRQVAGQSYNSEQLQSALRQRFGVGVGGEYLMSLFQLKTVDRGVYRWVAYQIKQQLLMMCVEYEVLLEQYNEKTILLCVFQSDHNPRLEQILTNQVLPAVLEEVQCNVAVGRFSDCEGIHNQVEELRTLLPYSLVLPQGTLLTADCLTAFDTLMPDLEGLENKGKHAVKTEQAEVLLEVTKAFIQTVVQATYPPKDIVDAVLHYLCVLSLTAEQAGLYEGFDYNQMVTQVSAISSLEQLKEYIEQTTATLLTKETTIAASAANLVVSRTIGYIQKQYGEELSLSVLSEQVGVTPEYLSSLFSKEMGVSLMSFLKNFRISQAKRLLKQKELKINEVATQVGFRDPKYFNRVFKEINGVSPSEYRAAQL